MGRTAGSHLQRITYALRPYPHQSTPTYPLLAVCQEETQMPQHQQSTKLRLRLFPSWVLFGFRFRAAAAAANSVKVLTKWLGCATVDHVRDPRPTFNGQREHHQKAITQWPEPESYFNRRKGLKSDYKLHMSGE